MKRKFVCLMLGLSIITSYSVTVCASDECDTPEVIEFEDEYLEDDMEASEIMNVEEELIEDVEYEEELLAWDIEDEDIMLYSLEEEYSEEDLGFIVDDSDDSEDLEELEPLDLSVEAALNAYGTLIWAVETCNTDQVRDALMAFKEAESLLTDVQKEELDENAIDYLADVFEVEMILDVLDTYHAYKADSNEDSAVDFITAYDIYLENSENMLIRAMFESISDVEDIYINAKVRAGDLAEEEIWGNEDSSDALKVYQAYTELAASLNKKTYEAFAESYEVFGEVIDIFNDKLDENEWEELVSLLSVKNKDAARNEVTSTYILVHVLMDIGSAYNDFVLNPDMETAAILAELYEGIYNSDKYSDETLTVLIQEVYTDFDEMYVKACSILYDEMEEYASDDSEEESLEEETYEEEAYEEDAVNMVTANSTTVNMVSSNTMMKAPVETADYSNAGVNVFALLVAAVTMCIIGKKRYTKQ